MLTAIKAWRDQGYKNIYGTGTIQDWCARFTAHCSAMHTVSVLDIGCGDGRDLLAIQKRIGRDRRIHLCGIECTPDLANQAARKGVETFPIDLESMSLPFEDNLFDLVIANQVLEHLKNWIWAFHEQVRVTRPGGVVIIGVPNLAALHNRLLILVGRQPSCIKADGPHVRGFTHHEICRLARSANGLEILDSSGTFMYGFPPGLGRKLGERFPTLSATMLIAFRKTSEAASVLSLLSESARFETNYYVG